jgi:hypothetical protein
MCSVLGERCSVRKGLAAHNLGHGHAVDRRDSIGRNDAEALLVGALEVDCLRLDRVDGAVSLHVEVDVEAVPRDRALLGAGDWRRCVRQHQQHE